MGIPFKVPYSQNLYVARITGRDPKFKYERTFIDYTRRDAATKTVFYELPVEDAFYEVRTGTNKRFYVTRANDWQAHEVFEDDIYRLVRGKTIAQVLSSKVPYTEAEPEFVVVDLDASEDDILNGDLT